MRSALVVAFALGAAAATPATASAGDPIPPKARKLAERGRELHNAGDYANAIAAFKEAYVLAPSPGLLFNLAQAYRLQGNCDDAELMYKRYLAAGPSPEERALAEGHLATVVRCLQKRNLNLPMDAEMARARMVISPSEQLLAATSPEARRRSSGRARLVKRIGGGAVIGGGVALLAAGYYGLEAWSASREVERRSAAGAKWRELEPIHARGERDASTARWLGVAGGATAAAGVTMYLLGRRAERAVPVAIVPTARGAKIGVAWSF